MRKIVLVFVVLICVVLNSYHSLLLAQARSEVWAKIFGEVFTASETYENLKYLCYEIGGRVTGTESGWKAEKFVERKFNEYGLQNVHLEPFSLTAWERESIQVKVIAPVEKELYAVAMGNTPSTPEAGLTCEVIDIGHGYRKEFEAVKERVSGKMVIVDTGTLADKRRLHRSEKMSLAEEYGASGFIFINNTPGNIPRAGTVSIGGFATIPGFSVSKEHGEWLRSLLRDGKKTIIKAYIKNRIAKTVAHNVVGEIIGTEKPEEIIIVGGHLDSWDLGQGTFDNGVGAVVVMEAARVLAKLDQKPKRTIRFVLFMGEELGLYGSKAYVEQHRDEMDNILMMMNLDMSGDPYGYSLIGVPEASPFFETLAANLKHIGMDEDKVSSGVWLHSDHQAFLIEGVPTMSVASSLRPEQGRYYHSAGDTFDKFTERDQNNCAAVVAVTLWELANMPERIAKRKSDSEVKEMLLKNNLKEALEAQKSWKWKD